MLVQTQTNTLRRLEDNKWLKLFGKVILNFKETLEEEPQKIRSDMPAFVYVSLRESNFQFRRKRKL